MTTEYIAPREQQERELAAFEKGRIQGEMEAARRLEAERLTHKTMAPEAAEVPAAALAPVPDVVEINRLTWLQRGAFALGESCMIASLIISIVWIEMYRDTFGWENSTVGDGNFHNTVLLTCILGLICLGNAITNYRVLPLHTRPAINRAWYVFLMSSAIVCFTLAMVAEARSTSGEPNRFWSVADWCFALSYAVFVLHALYSMTSTLLEPVYHRHMDKHAKWTETGRHLESPEQRRDHSAYDPTAGRTIYTAAPKSLDFAIVPPANANVGAQVPVAPANAPRWAELPNTHAEDYWLLPRAKWATIGFLSLGVSTLMFIIAWEILEGVGKEHWAQGAGDAQTPIDESGPEAALIGALGLLLLAGLLSLAYTALPPRTTIVKNGGVVQDRRSSISHNAPTQLGGTGAHNVV